MKNVVIKGELRTDLGKKSTKGVRAKGLIPCVIYGGDSPVHFAVPVSAVRDIVYTPDFKIAQIEIEGQSYKTILKSYQTHPVTDAIEHIDFLRLIDGHAVKVELPVRFYGVSPGVKLGGKLLQTLRKIKVKTTPQYLRDEILMDISTMELGQSIRVRDIQGIEGIEITSSPGIPVATIEIPRALRSAAAAAEKGKK
jgi:large subunit ribosomal protein L25